MEMVRFVLSSSRRLRLADFLALITGSSHGWQPYYGWTIPTYNWTPPGRESSPDATATSVLTLFNRVEAEGMPLVEAEAHLEGSARLSVPAVVAQGPPRGHLQLVSYVATPRELGRRLTGLRFRL